MKEGPAAMFERILKLTANYARSFEAAGYTSLEEIAYVPIEELRRAAEIPEWLLEDIRRRAREHLLHEATNGEPPEQGLDA